MELNSEEASAVNDVIKSLGIENYTTTVSNASAKGENCMGTILRVESLFDALPAELTADVRSIINKTDDDKHKLSLIVKLAPKNEAFRRMIPIHDIFDREVHVYENILPTFERLQLSKGIHPKIDGFKSYPKLFKSHLEENDEFLIFADKCAEKFVMKNRLEQLDYDHISAVTKQLARYHALSFVLQKVEPETFRKLGTKIFRHSFFDKSNSEEYKASYQGIIKDAISTLDPVEDKEVYDAFKNYSTKMYDISLEQMTLNEREKYLVLSHGDFWMNNMLFKYDEEQNISEVCFVDFAMSAVTTPIWDLQHLIYCNAQNDLIENKVDDFLQLYYQTLSDLIKKFGEDPQELFPVEEYHRSIKEYFCMGVMYAPFACKTVFNTEGTSFDSLEKDATIKDAMEQFQGAMNVKSQNLYKNKISTVIKHSFKNKYF